MYTFAIMLQKVKWLNLKSKLNILWANLSQGDFWNALWVFVFMASFDSVYAPVGNTASQFIGVHVCVFAVHMDSDPLSAPAWSLSFLPHYALFSLPA